MGSVVYNFLIFFVVICKQAESMKHEAGGVLGEVKRKQTEATKAVDLLRALRKLREARKQEAEVKGTRALKTFTYFFIEKNETVVTPFLINKVQKFCD